MGKIGDLWWEVDADTKKFDKELKGTETKAKGFGKTLSAVGKAGAAALAATLVVGIAKVSKELVLASSEAEETQNKFDVVFRDISDAATAAADNLSESFGLSSTAAKSLIADTGDLLTGFGFTQESALELSDEVNQLAVDLASFTNFSGGAKGASEALTKALLGERESVKALGISILDADVKAKVLENTQKGITFETERQAKAFATLEIAQEQSKNAIGDFGRSIDSFANQSRIAEANVQDLKVALGDALLPTATNGVKVFNSLTKALTDYTEAANNAKSVALDLSDGALDQEKSLEELEAALEKIEKLNRSASGQGRFKAEIDTLKTLIATYGIEDTFLQKREGRLASEQANAEAAAATAAAEAERVAALGRSTEALDRLEEIRRESLTSDERKLEDLQNEINYWNELIGLVPGAEEVFIGLARQRNELRAKGKDDQETIVGLTEEQLEAEEALFQSAIEAAEGRAEADRLLEEQQQAELDRLDAIEAQYKQLASAGIGAVIGAVGDLGEALIAGEAAWSDLGKAGLNSIAAVLDALSAQLTAQAAVLVAQSFVPGFQGSLAGIGPALLGAGAASLSAGLLRGVAGSFEQGGIVPEVPGVPATGDNLLVAVNPNEKITPADEAQGTPAIIQIVLSDETIAEATVNVINNGRYLIDASRGITNL